MNSRGFYTVTLGLLVFAILAFSVFTFSSLNSSESAFTNTTAFAQVKQDWVNTAHILDRSVADAVVQYVKTRQLCSLDVQGISPSLQSHIQSIVTQLNQEGVTCTVTPAIQTTSDIGDVEVVLDIQCVQDNSGLHVQYTNTFLSIKKLRVQLNGGDCDYSVEDVPSSFTEVQGAMIVR